MTSVKIWLKCQYKELVTPPFHIYKISMKLGIFPDEMNIAKIKPLFKVGERDVLYKKI